MHIVFRQFRFFVLLVKRLDDRLEPLGLLRRMIFRKRFRQVRVRINNRPQQLLVFRMNVESHYCIYPVSNLYMFSAETYIHHTIIIWTDREELTGTCHTLLTYEQLNRWGVKFDKLILTKPVFDAMYDANAHNQSNIIKHHREE